MADRFNDTLRLDDAQCRSLVMRLNDEKSDSERSLRHDYFERVRLVVELECVGSPGQVSVLMKPWDLTAVEVRLLHGTFVHEGIRAIVILIASDGEQVRAPGKVSRCRLIEGRVHEVVVKFDESIEPASFIPAPPKAA